MILKQPHIAETLFNFEANQICVFSYPPPLNPYQISSLQFQVKTRLYVLN